MASFDSRIALLGQPVNSVDSWMEGAAQKQAYDINEAAAAQAREQQRNQGLSLIINGARAINAETDPQRKIAGLERLKAFASRFAPDSADRIASVTVDDLPVLMSAMTSYEDQLKYAKGEEEIRGERAKTALTGARIGDISADNERDWWKAQRSDANDRTRTGAYVANVGDQIGVRNRLADSTINDRDRKFELESQKQYATGFGQVPEGQLIGPGGGAADIPGARRKGDGAGGINFDDETKLRAEYNKQTDDFVTIDSAYQNVVSAAQSPSAAGDLSLIFAYMKMLDPSSVVREQEFANAQNAAGVPDRIRNLYNNLLNGERLNENQRNDFIGQAQKLYGNAERRLVSVGDRYKALSQSYGFDPGRVVIDRRSEAAAAGPARISDDAGYDALPSGAEFIAPDGSVRRKP